MKIPFPLHIIAAGALFALNLASALAVTLPAVEDTNSSKSRLAVSANNAASLAVSGSPAAPKSAFLKFNLADIPTTDPASILSARLRIYVAKVTKAGQLIVGYAMDHWDETVTAPQAEPGLTAFGMTPVVSKGKSFVSVDVTGIVRAWLGGAYPNDGFGISGDAQTSVLLGAKEGSGSGYPAELEVELTPGTIVSGSITAGALAPGFILPASALPQVGSANLSSNLTLGGTTSGTFSGSGTGLTSLNADAVAIAMATANFMEWVTVGDPGNPADTTSFGAVDTVFQIGKYEVTNAQYAAFLNAVAATDPNGLYSDFMGSDPRGGIVRLGIEGNYRYESKQFMANKPVIHVNFYDAIRFCNWMHNGMPRGAQSAATTEDGAYTIAGAATVSGRKGGARCFLPAENEWYKAAYYDPIKGGTGGYWKYPTRSDSVPGMVVANGVGDVPTFSAVTYPYDISGSPRANGAFQADWNGQNGNVITVGSTGLGGESACGAADMAGNAWEWNERIYGTYRGFRGGGWAAAVSDMISTNHSSWDPSDDGGTPYYGGQAGFRVAKP